MKIYRRPRTWLLLAFMLLILFVHLFFMNKIAGEHTADPNWKQELIDENADLQKDMADNPALPEAVKKQMQLAIQKNEYYIEKDMEPQAMNVWSYMEDASELVILVTIGVVVIAGDIVSSEFSGGTIKLLLIRPVSRTKILLVKYLAVLLYSVLMLVAVFVPAFLIGGALFGFTGGDMPYVYVSQVDNTVQEMATSSHVMLRMAMNSITLILIATISFMISAALRSTALAITVALMSMFVGMNLVTFFAQYSWVKYILFANLDLMQYIDGPILNEGMSMTFSFVILGVYFVLFQLFAWFMFAKRDVAA